MSYFWKTLPQKDALTKAEELSYLYIDKDKDHEAVIWRETNLFQRDC